MHGRMERCFFDFPPLPMLNNGSGRILYWNKGKEILIVIYPASFKERSEIMPYFQSNGVRLYYESIGSGPALVLLPPPALGTPSFLQQQEALQSHFQVITFDPLGNNNSSLNGKETLTIGEWAEDILALMNHLQLEKIIPCGYSLGGAPAQEFALRYPDRTKALILLCTFPEVNSWILKTKIKTGRFITWIRAKKLLGAGLSYSHTNRDDNQKQLYKAVQNSKTKLLQNMYINGEKYNVTEKLNEISCPVTYIYSRLDPVALPYVDIYQKNIYNITIVRIAELTAMHQIPTRAASQVNSIITSLHAE